MLQGQLQVDVVKLGEAGGQSAPKTAEQIMKALNFK